MSDKTMSGIQVLVDADALSKRIISDLTDVVGSLIHNTIKSFVIKPEDVKRYYESAFEHVAKKVFTEMLEADEAFKKNLRATLSQKMTDEIVKGMISKLYEYARRGY